MLLYNISNLKRHTINLIQNHQIFHYNKIIQVRLPLQFNKLSFWILATVTNLEDFFFIRKQNTFQLGL